MPGIIFSEASGLNDSIYGNSQAPIKSIITQNAEAFQNQSMVDKIFDMDTSNNWAEKLTTETSIGDFEDVGENGAYPITSFQEGYSKTIYMNTWKSRFEVTQNMIEDAKMGKIKSRANQFTTSYLRTREKFAANLLGSATGNTATFGNKTYDTTGSDGKPLFSNSHPSITKKGSQSNAFSYTTSQKMTEVIDAAQEKMQDFKDDDGNLLTVSPDTIIIPNVATLKRELFAAIGSELDPNTNNNAFNFQLGLWNVLIWPYLPKNIGGKPYFIMADMQFNKDYECAKWFDRIKLTVRSHVDDNTDANIWSGRARFGAGFGNWRSMALVGQGVTGTAL